MLFQEDTPDSIKLLPDPHEAIIDKLAAELGLQKVGWIFTDLVAEDVRKGTVKHLRDINTHFLTAEECILAAQLQNQHPSPCKLSSNGKFGSKFSTVVVSGMSLLYWCVGEDLVQCAWHKTSHAMLRQQKLELDSMQNTSLTDSKKARGMITGNPHKLCDR